MPAVQRGWLGAAVDRGFAWYHSLPPETCSYTIESLRIPIADKLSLAADLYRPVGRKPLGTLLFRTPYGISFPGSVDKARVYAARGYQVLYNSSRGTFDSDGEFEFGKHEASDGHAVVAWMRQQAWYTGSFATLGGSFNGFTQWALLNDPPPDMKTAIVQTAMTDFGALIWTNGALKLDMIAWSDVTSRMYRGDSFVSIFWALRSQAQRTAATMSTLPLTDSIEKFLGEKAPRWLQKAVATPDLEDDFWKAYQHNEALQKTNIPIMLTTGWNDILVDEVFDQYTALVQRGCSVYLHSGDYTHLQAQSKNTGEFLRWLDRNFDADNQSQEREPCKVRIQMMGTQQWRDLAKWPPACSSFELFLQSGGILSRTPPIEDSGESSFTFDPANPTPDMGLCVPFDPDGSARKGGDEALAKRDDVCTFTATLERDLQVCGRPIVELHRSSDSPFADLRVILSETLANGTCRIISEKYWRLSEEQTKQDCLRLETTTCAHVFRKGSTLRLLVAGGAHPRFLRNLGTGQSQAYGTEMRPVRQTIFHDKLRTSKIVLPETSI